MPQLRILEGSTFCICDEVGDIVEKTHGLFTEDMRVLSRLCLTIDGKRPLLLSSGTVDYFSAACFLRNPLTDNLPLDAVSIKRERFVGDGMQDNLVLQNQTMEALELRLAVDLGADFADVISVKEWDFTLGDPQHATPLPDPVEPEWDGENNQFVLTDDDGYVRTQVILSRRGEPKGTGVVYEVSLAPRERWELRIDVVPSPPDGPPRQPGAVERVFGRDTLIACLQTLVFGPELAQAALRELAALQATEDDPSRDAEPGKIVHELRRGKCAAKWFDRYYGTVDATPLFLILLSEVWRWTDDTAFARELQEPALAALRWIDEWGDRDGDGFVEYERRTERGLGNQSWKDSGDSQRFRDGRTASGSIAPCEVQGYVYDAKRRICELARDAWREPELAARLEREAEELRRRFNEAFWIEDRGGYYALALDGKKQQVDSLCSNIGHLLWSGIVPPERVDPVVDRLMGEELWSGWGIRTMSSGDAAFNPVSYHNGTVWPHDNSICAWGLARYARWPEAHRVIQTMLSAAGFFNHQLPEVFAGMPRSETSFPIAYPTAARPQAWAAGTPVLLLQLLLGLQPDRRRQVLDSVAPLELPSWAGDIRLTGVRAFDGAWDVRLQGGHVI